MKPKELTRELRQQIKQENENMLREVEADLKQQGYIYGKRIA